MICLEVVKPLLQCFRSPLVSGLTPSSGQCYDTWEPMLSAHLVANVSCRSFVSRAMTIVMSRQVALRFGWSTSRNLFSWKEGYMVCVATASCEVILSPFALFTGQYGAWTTPCAPPTKSTVGASAFYLFTPILTSKDLVSPSPLFFYPFVIHLFFVFHNTILTTSSRLW